MSDENPRLCLNCSTPLEGAFCHQCGQEDTHYVRGVLSLITEFFGEMGNWDGRLWRTLRPLFLRPAFLSNEYVKGRRVPYVPPLRLYLFISIVAFIVFSQLGSGLGINGNGLSPQEATELRDTIRAEIRDNTNDGVSNDTNTEESAPGVETPVVTPSERGGGSDIDRLARGEQTVSLGFLSEAENIELNAKLQLMAQRPKILVDKFFTVAPQMMLIMLPIFALFMKLIYIGSKRYYIEHVVLALHTHAFMLITLLLILGVNLIHSLLLDYGISTWLIWPFPWILKALWLWLPVYLFLAQKRFYRQSNLVTFIKFNITALFYCFLLSISIALGVIWSIWSA
ncbi:hypothetical protein CWE13_02285 [Aliidiomarina shirensis]|uniref:DUF3667 domain-containing protein n=1 Tax=Aliidiomarina shirensis TaxID=1048642 RepID=A0A432WXK8_9GAMM|nr:DUF3667 domain-containing protein [Aliidiomarina shirensis]RUO38489.1 hypothetical protein CWE13_02285 [Aliidiomarina shirensis]